MLRPLVKILMFLAMILLSVESEASDYIVDAQGRELRVAFPPHDRFVLQSSWSETGDIQLGVDVRFEAAWDFPDEQIWWRLRHRGLVATYLAASETTRFSLIEGDYWRHDTASVILIPGDINFKIPAPFDVTAGYQLLSGSAQGDSLTTLRTASFRFGADFMRDPAFRGRLAFAFFGRHDIEFDTDVDADTHRIVPLSGGEIRASWESANGRFRAGAQAECGYGVELAGENQQWSWRCGGEAEVEWIFAAINDLPISIPVQGSWAWQDEAEWEVHAGLRLSVAFN